MSPVTRNVYDNIRRSLEKVLDKNRDGLLTKKIPFNCIVAKEIGLKLDPKVVSAMKDLPLGHDAHTILPLLDVINAMEAYGKERWGLAGFDGEEESPSELPELEEAPAPSPEGEDNE